MDQCDEVSRELTGTGGGRAAAIHKLAEMIAPKTSFIYEITLSKQQAVTMMRDAMAAGFSIGLYYVVLAMATEAIGF